MRRGGIAISVLLALAGAAVVACSGGGGHNRTTTIKRPSFPQGFFPVLLEGTPSGLEPCKDPAPRTAGDVAFRGEGDLVAVSHGPDIVAVSRTDGACRVFAHASGATLISIVPGFSDDARLFAGDDAGRIWVIAPDGSSVSVYLDTGTGQPITGLAFAPKGYGDIAGSLLAAAGTAGVVRIAIGDLPTSSTFVASPGGSIVDLDFTDKKQLFAIRQVDATHGQIDQIEVSDTTGTVSTFQTGFTKPVGIGIDDDAGEIYVADAGDDILKTVPVGGGSPTRRARYDFDASEVNGIAFDGIFALAWITSGPLAIRASNLPPIDPSFALALAGPTSGYGDLELDRDGAFVFVANDEVDPVDDFLFGASRDARDVKKLETGIGSPPERLFAVAIDPNRELIYFASFSENAAVETGKIYKRDTNGDVSLLVDLTPGVRVLGLEIAPPTFGGFAGDLIATTEDGRMFAIDPLAATTPVPITLSQPAVHLVDLVFASTGELYAVDNRTSTTSRILCISATGTANILVSGSQLGLPDGIEIDEGADRLLVTSETGAGFQLLGVSVGGGCSGGTITALADLAIDDGFFPTGVVYDRLGTAVVHSGDDSTSLRAYSVAP